MLLRTLIAAICLLTVLAPSLTSAAPIVELLFTGGGNTLVVSPGQTFNVDLVMTAGPEGLSSYGVSMQFDSEGLDAFDLLSVSENLPSAFDFNLSPGPESTAESGLGLAGGVSTCEAATFGAGASSTSFVACTVQLVSTGLVGTFTLESGLFSVFDGLFDSAGVDQSSAAVFANASVTVPEPSSVFLWMAAGLAAAYRGRRLRSRFALASLVSMVAVAALNPLPAMAQLAAFTDSDGDQVHDGQDNCLGVSNPSQLDWDLDGYGNACDADLDNDGAVGLSDFNMLRAWFGSTCSDTDFDCRESDFDDDQAVGLSDFNFFRTAFGGSPGPSGLRPNLACAPLAIANFENPPAKTWGDLLTHARSIGLTTTIDASTCGGTSAGTRTIEGTLENPANPGATVKFVYAEFMWMSHLQIRHPDGSMSVFGPGGGGQIFPDGTTIALGPDGAPVGGSGGLSSPSGGVGAPNPPVIGPGGQPLGGCPVCWRVYACPFTLVGAGVGAVGGCSGAILTAGAAAGACLAAGVGVAGALDFCAQEIVNCRSRTCLSGACSGTCTYSGLCEKDDPTCCCPSASCPGGTACTTDRSYTSWGDFCGTGQVCNTGPGQLCRWKVTCRCGETRQSAPLLCGSQCRSWGPLSPNPPSASNCQCQ